MIITINGEQINFEMPLNIEDCLEQQGFENMTVAVARNGAFVPKEEHGNTTLNEGDALDIVAPMQGG